MTTGLQLALAGGALIGLGVALLLWRLVPADPDLADALARLSPQHATRIDPPHRRGRRRPRAARGVGDARPSRPGRGPGPRPGSWRSCGSRSPGSTARRSCSRWSG